MNEEPLTPAEIQSLLRGAPSTEDTNTAVTVRAPAAMPAEAIARLDPDLLAGLTRIHADFCRRLSASLCGLLRDDVRVRMTSVRPLRWREFCQHAAPPACVAVLQAESLGVEGVLHVSTPILFALIDRLLGGHGRPSTPPPCRPLTQIEQRLALRIVREAATALSAAWSMAVPLNLCDERLIDDAESAAIVVPEETMLASDCEVALGPIRGVVQFCLPLRTIESQRKRLAGAATATPVGLKMEVTAHLPETTMTEDELRNLEIGDIITTPHSATDPVLVSVEGLPKFTARVGRDQGRLAVRIEDRLAGEGPPQ